MPSEHSSKFSFLEKFERVSSKTALRHLIYYCNPLQLLAALYPAAFAASIESKVMRFSGLMRLAPGQSGRWYLVPDLEPTTTVFPVVSSFETSAVVSMVLVAGGGVGAAKIAAPAPFWPLRTGFSGAFWSRTDSLPKLNDAAETKTSKTP